MTLNGVMAVTLRYFTEFGKHTFQHITAASIGVTAKSLRAKTDRKSAISLHRGQFDPKFQVEGVDPTNYFCTYS